MSEKSYVSLEQHVCHVCGTAFDTGVIFMHKRLCASMEHHTKTGWGLCPEHQKFYDDGFVALIEIDPELSELGTIGVKPENAHRTGRMAHLKREAFTNVFDVPIKDEQAFIFIEPGVIEQLQMMVAQ